MKRLTYVEIPATDVQRAASFYAAVLGWKVEFRTADDARFEDEAAQLIGRWVIGRTCTEHGILLYFYVDDVAEATARMAANAGDLIDAPRLEGDTLIARLRDPEGNVIGIWQFAKPGA